MATVTGLTAARMKEIEDASIVDGDVVSGNLILTKHDGTTKDAGSVIGPAGPQGPQGLVGIPGEVKLWPGETLPATTYGKWVWADGAIYPIGSHPIAAAHIGTRWNRFDGAGDPGSGNFRVPDLRGLVAAGLDAMPGGARKGRMTRDEAIVIALRTGEEKHKLIDTEHALHNHGSVGVSGSISGSATGGGHEHSVSIGNTGPGYGMSNQTSFYAQAVLLKGTAGNIFGTGGGGGHSHSVGGTFSGSGGTNNQGGDIPHENVQPTVFVPYIVCLDG